MEVPITERCQKTGSAQPAPGKIDIQKTYSFRLSEKNRVLFKETNGSNYARYKHGHTTGTALCFTRP